MSSIGEHLLLISVSAENFGFSSAATAALSVVEVAVSLKGIATLGHATQLVLWSRSSRSSVTVVEHSFAALERLQREMEKPGPLREVSK